MKTVIILFVVVVVARAQNLTITLPSGIITGCTVVTLTFTGGTAPFTFRLGENRNVPWFTDSIYYWIVPPLSEPMIDTYIYATDRRGVWGQSRPFSIYAGLCDETSTTSSTPSPTTSSITPSPSSNTGLIAGAAFGGSAALILIMLAVWFYVRRKRSPNMTGQPGSSVPAMEGGTESITTPYVRSNPADSAGTPFASPYFDNDAVSPPIGPSSSGYYSTNPASSSIPGGYAPYSPPTTMQSPTSSRQNRPSRQSMVNKVTSPTTNEDFSPIYDATTTGANSQRARAAEEERARLYDTLITDFCANNRDLISTELERKLYTARYLPSDNPSDIPYEHWRNAYGVEFFDLRRLQEAYERNLATNVRVNAAEKALPQAAQNAKEKGLHSSPDVEP